jgi:hypothetical protein
MGGEGAARGPLALSVIIVLPSGAVQRLIAALRRDGGATNTVLRAIANRQRQSQSLSKARHHGVLRCSADFSC